MERGMGSEPWFNEVPRLIRERLPNVHSLEVIGLGYFLGKPPTEEFFKPLSQIPLLRRLSLVRCCIPNDALNSFVTNIPGLEDLHIHNQWLYGFHTSPPFDLSHIPPPRFLPPLRSFRYHNDDRSGPSSFAFLQWIGLLGTLRSLGIHINRKGSSEKLGLLLSHLGSALEHVELRFPLFHKRPHVTVRDGEGVFDSMCECSLPDSIPFKDT